MRAERALVAGKGQLRPVLQLADEDDALARERAGAARRRHAHLLVPLVLPARGPGSPEAQSGHLVAQACMAVWHWAPSARRRGQGIWLFRHAWLSGTGLWNARYPCKQASELGTPRL